MPEVQPKNESEQTKHLTEYLIHAGQAEMARSGNLRLSRRHLRLA